MIPGFLISWVTFPGVVVHEFAHQFFCRLFGVKVLDVCYFRLGTPSGYVQHEHVESIYQDVVISIGPFFVNTIIAALISFPAAINTLDFRTGDALDYFLLWLGISFAMHAFPSTGDAKCIWVALKTKQVPLAAKIVAMPIVGCIYLGTLGSMMWLDLLYGLTVALALPHLLALLWT